MFVQYYKECSLLIKAKLICEALLFTPYGMLDSKELVSKYLKPPQLAALTSKAGQSKEDKSQSVSRLNYFNNNTQITDYSPGYLSNTPTYRRTLKRVCSC